MIFKARRWLKIKQQPKVQGAPKAKPKKSGR